MALLCGCFWWAFRKVCQAVGEHVSAGCLRHSRSSLQTAALQAVLRPGCPDDYIFRVPLGTTKKGPCFAATPLLAETYCPLLSLCCAVPRWLQSFGILTPAAP